MALPADKDQYAITDTVLRQTECSTTFGETAVELNLRFMGDTADVVGLASEYRKGTLVNKSNVFTKFAELSGFDTATIEVMGTVQSSKSTTKKGCGVATVVLSFPYDGKITPSGDNEPDQRKIVLWAEKTTKYQFPLEKYAGEVASDSTEYANAGDFAGWKNENGTNAENYKEFRYSVNDTSAVALSGNTLELAKKAYAGIDNVERGFPEVIRTTNYYYIKGDDEEVEASIVRKIGENPNLYEIDQTPNAVWKDKFPDHSWLKATYDLNFGESEYTKFWNATVTESWMGIPTSAMGPWDKNLYGTGNDRWDFIAASGQE